jgi:hypothetical protein
MGEAMEWILNDGCDGWMDGWMGFWERERNNGEGLM